jgi:hypothetical protein
LSNVDECGQPLLTDDELEYVYVALEWAAGQGYNVDASRG